MELLNDQLVGPDRTATVQTHDLTEYDALPRTEQNIK